VPTLAKVYGGTKDSFANLQSMTRIHSQVLLLKQLNKKSKTITETLVLKSRDLYQLMFLCQTTFYFKFFPKESKIINIECYENLPRFTHEIVRLLTLPKEFSFKTVKICCKWSQNWLPFLNHFLRESWNKFRSIIYTTVILIDQCSDNHSWKIYNKWEQCQDAIVELDYLLRYMSMGVTRIGNALLCSSCHQTDFTGAVFDVPVYCDECGESVPVDSLCIACINFCSCIELIFDFKECEFKNACGRVICAKRFGKVPCGKKWRSRNCHLIDQYVDIDDENHEVL
jgi:hypothetical protein